MAGNTNEVRKDQQSVIEHESCDRTDEGDSEECVLEEHPHLFKRKHSILTFVRTASVSQAASRFSSITLSEVGENEGSKSSCMKVSESGKPQQSSEVSFASVAFIVELLRTTAFLGAWS